MNLIDIFQIRLIKADYRKFPQKEHFNMQYINLDNYRLFNREINNVLSYIKTDLPEWTEAPSYKDIIKRFKANSHCLLFYYNKECIGWNWGNKNVCFDWINIVQELPEGEIYGGGCFVSRSIERPANAGLYNYNMIFDYWINKMGYHTVYGYVDKWNKAALRVNFQNGLTVYNYLKDDNGK